MEDLTMLENVEAKWELKEKQVEYLDAMAKKHNLPDRSKALRCLITYAMEKSEQEDAIFTEVRCTNC